MADVNVTILGLERAGASFGLALKRYMAQKEASHRFTIVGHDRRSFNVKEAKRLGAIDSSASNPADAVANAHIVLLAAHYNQTPDLYQTIGPALKPGAVVLDASPLKEPSIGWAAEALPAEADIAAYMVGIAPMLNPAMLYDLHTEVEGARPDLFDNSLFILAPAADCPAEAVDLAAEFGRIVGGQVRFMDPGEYDGLAAAMEGLPVTLAVALFTTFLRSRGWDDLQRQANPSFSALMAPLRYQHPESIWGLLQHNRKNVARRLTDLIDTLEQLRDSLESDEEGLALEAVVVEAAGKYEEWEGRRLANRFEREESDMPQGNVFSSMSGMFFGRRPKKSEGGAKK